MLINSPVLGSLLGGLGLSSAQQANQTEDNTNTENPVTETVTEATDSGGVKFDFSAEAQESGAQGSGTTGSDADTDSGAAANASQAQGSDEASMSAYFYAAQWAQSLQAANPEPAESGMDESFSFATEPYRRDVVSEYFSEQTIHFMGKKLATIGADGVISSGDSNDGSVQPLQVPKSLGKF